MLVVTSQLEPTQRARAFSNQPELRRALILNELETTRLPRIQRVALEENKSSALDRASELGVATADLIDLRGDLLLHRVDLFLCHCAEVGLSPSPDSVG